MALINRMTSIVSVPAGPAWEPLAEGVTFIAILAVSAGRVQVHLQGENDPDPVGDDTDGYLPLSRGISGSETGFSAGGMPENTKVWVRAVGSGAEQISVVAY